VPTSLNEIYKAIGSLQSDVKNLTRLIEAQNQRSSESRRRVYDRLDELGNVVDNIEDRLKASEQVIKDIEPLARDFGAVRDKSKTVLAVIIAGWTLLGGFLMWIGNSVLEWAIQRIGGS